MGSIVRYYLFIALGVFGCCSARHVSAQTIATIFRPVCSEGENRTPDDALVDMRSFNGIAIGSGGLYITEWNSGDVLKVDFSGGCMQPIGHKANSPRPDHLTTLGASVMYPHGIATDKAGNIYVAQYHGCVVRRIAPDGSAAIIAGKSICRYGGDGGPATAAMLGVPNDVAADDNGNVYVTDELNHIVRKITPDGFIVTVAGTPEAKGYNGDGGPAVLARLNMPWGIAVNTEGHIFIADTKNNVVRRVDAEGIITTYAGNGTKGYGGDNGPATAAKLNGPKGIEVDKDGNLFIADEQNHVVRKVTPSGIITTCAGTGIRGASRDGVPATAAMLTNPRDVAVDDAGNLYIIDFSNDNTRRIHMVSMPGSDGAVKVSLGESSGRFIQIENCTYETVSILDAGGKTVSQQAVTGRTFRIDISMLPPGNYTLDFRKNGYNNKTVLFSVSEQ